MRKNRPHKRSKYGWWAIVVGAFLGYAVLQNPGFTGKRTDQGAAELPDSMAEEMKKELRSPAGARYETIRKRLESSPDLSSRGTKRLPRRELEELIRIRLQLARVSDQRLNAPEAEGCAAVKELMEHAPSLDENLRERTLRSMVGP